MTRNIATGCHAHVNPQTYIWTTLTGCIALKRCVRNVAPCSTPFSPSLKPAMEWPEIYNYQVWNPRNTHIDMKDDTHLGGFKKSTHPFEEIIPKQVTIVITVNSKLSKHGLYTCLFCNHLSDKPQPLSPRSIKLCFILLMLGCQDIMNSNASAMNPRRLYWQHRVITQKSLTLSPRTTRDTQFEIWTVHFNLPAPTGKASDWAAQDETINRWFCFYAVYVVIVKLNQTVLFKFWNMQKGFAVQTSDCCPHVRRM